MSKIQERLIVWKTRLLDTSRRNRLLHLQRRRGLVEVVAPSADEVFERLVTQGRKMTFTGTASQSIVEDNAEIAAESVGESDEFSPFVASGDGERAAVDVAHVNGNGMVELAPIVGIEATVFLVSQNGNGALRDVAEAVWVHPLTESCPEVELICGEENGAERDEQKAQTESELNVGELEREEASQQITPPVRGAVEKEGVFWLQTEMMEGQLTSALYNLRSQARTAMEEQGVNVLFLSLGVLNWVEQTTKETMRSPLLLVPVYLDRASVTQPFTLTVRDQDVLMNPTLAHKLHSDYRVQLPRVPEEGEVWTPEGVFETVRESVKNLAGWSVEPNVYLDLFSFEKLVMLSDMDAHTQEIAEHPLLRAFGGDAADLPAPPDLKMQNLDDAVNPADTYQVLEADASQQLAIEWAKRGVSFVIQGPPGTGKSQTIANIIAEALGQNKKVLFVSAKMAALQVVAKRLAECGLENFYLEAHSHHTSRGALVAQLGQALNETYPPSAPGTERLAQLGEVRGELNALARALYTSVMPLGQSPFQAFAALAGLEDAPDLYFAIEDVREWDGKRFEQMVARLESLADRLDVIGGGGERREDREERRDDSAKDALGRRRVEGEYPWRGVALGGYTFKARSEIEFRFGELMQLLTQVEQAGARVAEGLTLARPGSLAEIERVAAIAQHALETPTPPTSWFRASETTELRAMAQAGRARASEYAQIYAEFSTTFLDLLVERYDLDEMGQRLVEAKSRTLRGLDGKFRQDMRVMREMTKEGDAVSLDEAIRGITQAQALRRLRAEMSAADAEFGERFGRVYKGLETDWQMAQAQLDWVDEMNELFASEGAPETFVALVCTRAARVFAMQPQYRELRALRRRLTGEWDFLTRLFPQEVEELYRAPVIQVRGWLAKRLERIDELQEWLELRKDSDEIEALGGGGFLESARAAQLEGDQLKAAFLKRFYLLWLDAVYEQIPVLQVSEELYRRQVTQFCKADVEQQLNARERLRNKLDTMRPAVGWSDARSSEVTLLKRETAKRKHHKSIRRLVSEIPNLLLTLKPCVMMSPLSVSQYLVTAPVKFDLVIFDEASQIPPEEAVPAILRAKQVIVAGDEQQLPPTPFFQTLEEADDDELQDVNALESLLQEASVVLPEVHLLWHYRSRHEALPAFSNHHFYQDRLITFPNALLNDPQRGVAFVHVAEGIYDRAGTRTNAIEAQRVAELVLAHFRNSPKRSLGIVTFSQPQRAAVDMEVQNLLRVEPELERFVNGKGEDAFFVKSLENVQGDERDVMIFSVGYGRDVNGTLVMNFGPLNGQDGARRLNVAITRARDKVIVVSSLLPAELDLSRTGSRGVQLLRAYMEYARRGGIDDERRITNDERRRLEDERGIGRGESLSGDRELRESVREALLAKGYEVHAGVGVGGERVDLALVDPEDPNHYALGIEFDGEAYRRAGTARDRERLRMQVLEKLGWRMYRLRARDWATNPARQVERIEQLMSVLDTPSGAWSKAGRVRIMPRRDEGSVEVSPANGKDGEGADALVPTGMMIYRYAELARQGTPEQFFRADAGTVQELFVQLAEQEGPVHWNAAARRIAACWGIGRVTTPVEHRLDEMLSDVVTQGRVVLRDDFLWSPVTMDVMVRRPGPGQEPRPIEEIAPEEIAKAAYLNLRNALSLTEEDWVLLTARVLGFARVTERVKRRLLGAMERLEENGIVGREEGKVVLKSLELEG